MGHTKRCAFLCVLAALAVPAQAQPVVYRGTDGPGKGKHIVFLAGDHEYRSEETLPAIARLLAKHHGFKCTVLFSVDRNTGEIKPGSSWMPGTEALESADLMVIFLRFQNFPKEQMQPIVDYLDRAGPVVGLRTSTHAFKIPGNSEFARFDFKFPGKEFRGGFGRQVLGETWVGHYGRNHRMSTRLNLVPKAGAHPVLRGVSNAWVYSGGYWADPMPDSNVLAMAQPLNGMKPDSPVAEDKKPCPAAWVRSYKNGQGKSGRVFTSTCGASQDILNVGFRRMLVNACFWACGLEDRIVANAKIDLVGPYQPLTFRGGGYRRGVKPADIADLKSPILPGKPPPKPTGKKKTGKKKAGKKKTGNNPPSKDARNTTTGKPAAPRDPKFAKFGIYQQTAPRAIRVEPASTTLPLQLHSGDRIALIGNSLLDRLRHAGHIETLLHQRFPDHRLHVRNLSWSADEITQQPRPANFADLQQHLAHEKIDVILAAYGFNESFQGQGGLAAFRSNLLTYLAGLKTSAFNGKTAPRIVLLSPIANENLDGVAAGDWNNARIRLYLEVMREVAAEQKIAFIDVFSRTEEAMKSPGTDLTINGCHLNEAGHALLASTVYRELFGEAAPKFNEPLRAAIIDKNRQYFRRYRPLNTFYYTGDRNKSYGYLDFLPAMQNFDLMVANRERRIWAIASGEDVPAKVNDKNLPPLPKTTESRGANQWMSAADELKMFKIDPRFEVNLFAGEEQFPDIAAPIQMRWDAKGRLWVSCSTTYPHVYPGNEPNDKLVVLEDTDGDGRADRSTVFAEDLNIPLSFEFGDGGVYVSEMPDLTFLKDTDGDGRADLRRRVLTGFGTEDSHHALHDFTWTPDGDLIWRESVFHHSQVETPHGPVRQQNSGWFRFQPRTQRLISFGSYRSTNPWGVTFDDWGQHVASHPVYAAAFHSLDPPYPQQHPRPAGLRAYSGVCGQEFLDFATFPDELRGGFVKVRYKPTNRVEIHKWVESEFGYDEQYVSDLIFSRNLSFIPVDLRFGPRGALYVCDWYNPIKGHAQYSLRDERRDRHSGRIWRITTKGKPVQKPPKIFGATNAQLLDILKRPEYRYRYWAKRELRGRDPDRVKRALDAWVVDLNPGDPRLRHHQLEAVWAYRWIGRADMGNPAAIPAKRSGKSSETSLLRELLSCEDHHARAAATQQLRYWHPQLPDAISLLRTAANDANGIVRMEAAIAASHIGSRPALDAMLDVFKHPRKGHMAYAITCALGSHTLRRHWEQEPNLGIAKLLKQASRTEGLKEPTPNASQAQFDSQANLKLVRIGCVPERMKYTIPQFAVLAGQPVKVVFVNPDATDHNLLFVRPGALEEVGLAANQMAKDPRNANSDFIPQQKRALIIEASPMIGPNRKNQVHVLRFQAPTEPGLYPYVCTFPGHWVIMKGTMVVAADLDDVDAMLAAAKPRIVKEWKMADLALTKVRTDERSIMRGMQAYTKARCNQCHLHSGHGVNLGPDLTKIGERFKGQKLLRQILEPSHEINKKYQAWQFITTEGKVVTGVVHSEDAKGIRVIPNLLTPKVVTTLSPGDIELRRASTISSMPEGLANMLTREEIENLVAFLQGGGYKLPEHLKHQHGRKHQERDNEK